MRYFILSASILIFLYSCGPTQKIVKKEVTEKTPSSKYDESFDPLSLDDDDIVLESANTVKNKQEEKSSVVHDTDPQQDIYIEQEVDGWRVQIFVSNNFEGATVKQEQAKIQFEPLGHTVYLIFETPYYKIRVGDTSDHIAAEELRDTAKSMGYDQAFLVRSKVIVKKSER